MISKIIISALLLIQLVSLNVLANEDTWATAQVKLDENNIISGFMTDTGKFRVSDFPVMNANLIISGGYFKGRGEAAKGLCTSFGSSLQATKLVSKNHYTLKATIYPFATKLVKNYPVAIENLPAYGSIFVTLKRSANSIVTDISSTDFETRINRFVMNDLNNILATGNMELDLNQMDDVACDLILGGSQIVVNVSIHYESPKHERIVTLTGTEFSKIYEDIKSRKVSVTSPVSRAIVNGGLLEQSLHLQLGKGIYEYGDEQFIKISNLIFNNNNAVNVINSDQYDSVASILDVLKTNPVINTVKLVLNPVVGN